MTEQGKQPSRLFTGDERRTVPALEVVTQPELRRCPTCQTPLYGCAQGIGVCCGLCQPGHANSQDVGTAVDSSGRVGPVTEGGPASDEHGAPWQPGDPVHHETPEVRVCLACGTSWTEWAVTCPTCDAPQAEASYADVGEGDENAPSASLGNDD